MLTGLYLEPGRKQNPRWVAIWTYRTTTSRRCIHETLPLTPATASREEAGAYAADNPPEEIL